MRMVEMNDIKAYSVEDITRDDRCTTIVFAKSVSEAKTIALSTDTCEYARYIDIRANAYPMLTIFTKGNAR